MSETDKHMLDEVEENHNPLAVMERLHTVLSQEEEYAFMSLLFSSSATVRHNNFGLSRKEVVKLLGLSKDDEEGFDSFLRRVNTAIARYFRCIYDENQDQVVVVMRVPARQAREMVSEKSLALLMFTFYHQDVLQNEYTLFMQYLSALGHQSTNARRKVQANLEPLLKIGALQRINPPSHEEAYVLTPIGRHMFSDSFLKRYTEFSQSQQLNMEEVLRFFKRYNIQDGETV